MQKTDGCQTRKEKENRRGNQRKRDDQLFEDSHLFALLFKKTATGVGDVDWLGKFPIGGPRFGMSS